MLGTVLDVGFTTVNMTKFQPSRITMFNEGNRQVNRSLQSSAGKCYNGYALFYQNFILVAVKCNSHPLSYSRTDYMLYIVQHKGITQSII